MDELIKLVTEKANISEDQARQAVTTVLDFLKTKLPAPVASQIDGLLSGGGNIAGSLGDAAKGLGGLFGRK